MKKIKATFIGENGSLGYVSGKEYSLLATQQNCGYITVERLSGGGQCVYDSLYAFLKNWTLIKTEDAID